MYRLVRAIGDYIPLRTQQRVRRHTNRLRLGVLYRTEPLSEHGWARGTPIDRVYIDRFLEQNRADIRGHVLEVKDSRYTHRFGSGVSRADVLDIDPANPDATLIGDLTRADELPAGEFDCFILTQTLQYVSDPRQAILNCHGLLRPGGVLLATVPTITRADSSYGEAFDRWRFTAAACRDLVGAVFGEDNTTIEGHGNVLSAIAFLGGLAAEELREADLWTNSPDYHMLISFRAKKEHVD